jgi:hypothetical protein
MIEEFNQLTSKMKVNDKSAKKFDKKDLVINLKKNEKG